MENKTIENHKIKTEEHQMRVDGHVLSEKTVTTFIEGRHSGMEDNYDATAIVEFSRSIENHQNRRLVVVKEHFKEGFITGKRVMESRVQSGNSYAQSSWWPFLSNRGQAPMENEVENGEPRHMTKDDREQFEKDWDKLSNLAFNQWPASFDTNPHLPPNFWFQIY